MVLLDNGKSSQSHLRAHQWSSPVTAPKDTTSNGFCGFVCAELAATGASPGLGTFPVKWLPPRSLRGKPKL